MRQDRSEFRCWPIGEDFYPRQTGPLIEVLRAFTLQASTGDFALADHRRRTAMSLVDRVEQGAVRRRHFIARLI